MIGWLPWLVRKILSMLLFSSLWGARFCLWLGPTSSSPGISVYTNPTGFFQDFVGFTSQRMLVSWDTQYIVSSNVALKIIIDSLRPSISCRSPLFRHQQKNPTVGKCPSPGTAGNRRWRWRRRGISGRVWLPTGASGPWSTGLGCWWRLGYI